MVDNANWGKTLSISLINRIIKAVKDEKTTKMMKMTSDVMVAVATTIQKDRQGNC